MSNHTSHQIPIEINGNLKFSQIWHGDIFKKKYNVILLFE